MDAPDNPPAFPRSDPDQLSHHEPGMTLLDWFAGQALASTAIQEIDAPEIARDCYSLAEAMMAERAKRGL
jgi:hypothetical protein